ncbi:MAG: hypothetical protein OEL57_07390 [Trichlorobacter sp.]|uniref:hypothetical protein n=1 Tax=Trichlorobacter sp. TaxID=2911007 RepID=UPI00256C00EB|nr:hypothetical protein [Trichlorobacter sp.]MDK9717717.1 hypothetical protein [Trichlorobacter sp.]
MQKSQLIEIACDLKISVQHERGWGNKTYNLETAIALLNATENFLPEWNKDSATQAVERAFEWAKAEADTNPARLLRKRLAVERQKKCKNHNLLKLLVT